MNLVLRPAVVVPILMGFFYGPLVGLGVGFFGNALGDWLTFNGANPSLIPRAFTFWHSHLGNGLMGFIPGLYAWIFKPRYLTFRQVVTALVVAVVGVAIAMFTSSTFDWWLCRAESPQPWCRAIGPTFEFVMTTRFVPLFTSNAINTLILVPIVMYNAERLELRQTMWLRSGLLRRLLICDHDLRSVAYAFARLLPHAAVLAQPAVDGDGSGKPAALDDHVDGAKSC
ncbi:MAG: hypothetical protein KatS3mg060_3086 [Dehalococcoidia bacterium]|nr:MAG: hypothetical protein KatS3mg060_3086 [Dehalococcoidia bacterium]